MKDRITRSPESTTTSPGQFGELLGRIFALLRGRTQARRRRRATDNPPPSRLLLRGRRHLALPPGRDRVGVGLFPRESIDDQPCDNCKAQIDLGLARRTSHYSLPALEENASQISRLPVAIRIVLESVRATATSASPATVRLPRELEAAARARQSVHCRARVLNCAGRISRCCVTSPRPRGSHALGFAPGWSSRGLVDMALDHDHIDYTARPTRSREQALEIDATKSVSLREVGDAGLQRAFLLPRGWASCHLNLNSRAGFPKKTVWSFPIRSSSTDSHTACRWARHRRLGVGGLNSEARCSGSRLFP